LTKHASAGDRSIEQWFLVAIGDDDKAAEAVAKSANAADAVVEIVGHRSGHARSLRNQRGDRRQTCTANFLMSWMFRLAEAARREELGLPWGPTSLLEAGGATPGLPGGMTAKSSLDSAPTS